MKYDAVQEARDPPTHYNGWIRGGSVKVRLTNQPRINHRNKHDGVTNHEARDVQRDRQGEKTKENEMKPRRGRRLRPRM